MMGKEKIKNKISIFTEILLTLRLLSKSSTKQVSCMALRKDFSKIASFGYNGSYSGAEINPQTGTEEDSLEPGQSGFIHAEINMIAKFREHDPENYIIMLSYSPCKMCTKTLINAGFKHVYWVEDYREQEHLKYFKKKGISYGKMEDLEKDYDLLII